MFPVYTGINRPLVALVVLQMSVPCIHRDKPAVRAGAIVFRDVFPVYTGINR